MASQFSNEEKLDILEFYFKNNRNAEIALNSYFERYPERNQPHLQYCRKLVINLLNHGSFEKSRVKNYNINNENRDMNIQQHFDEYPSVSTRNAEREIGIPKSTIQRVLTKNKYHPYKPTIVQELRAGDPIRRLGFCNWFQEKCIQNANFPNLVIWTDESHLSNCGIFNKHNRHHWSVANPHLRAERRLQTRFGFNVWCGIYGKNCYYF